MPHRLLSILGLLLALGACSKSEKLADAQPAETPGALIQRFGLAFHEADRDDLVRCLMGSKAEKHAVASVTDFAQAVFRFRDDFIKAYGKQEWERFLDPEQAPEGGDTSLSLVTEADLKELEQIDIEIEGDTVAYASFPNLHDRLKMVKVDGGWLVEAGSILPPNAEPEAFREMMTTMASLIGKYQQAIGHPGVSGEDIDAELGTAMMKKLFGISFPREPRFDIEKIAK